MRKRKKGSIKKGGREGKNGIIESGVAPAFHHPL